MTHQLALLASLMLVAAAPCGAQSPASDAPATSATPAAKPASSTASSSPTSSTTAPATAPAGTDSTAAASKPASAATDASSDPSPEVLKEARREGFKPKKRDGVTKFCYTDATMGTRFETEKCFDQAHMEMLVQQRQDQRNQLSKPVACGGPSCNGH
jgi:hypothetical protein